MTDWAIPQQARLKYTQLFNLHDRVRSGFLSGLQCRDILMQSGLARNILAEIWNLSDIDGDGQLTREEFILAMHLTNQVRAGQSLPAELPPDLVPPSYRKARTNSTTSIQSAASSSIVASSNVDESNELKLAGSTLNNDTFENKRRENFEKGRAELEKRRLKILEQQSAIVRDQLEASKKQVTEAKAKIDSMRIDRDSKMAIITTLEAQLQDLRDKKERLLQEEQTLIAIEKDLKLKASQAELRKTENTAKTEPSTTFTPPPITDYSTPDYQESKFDDAFIPGDIVGNKISNIQDEITSHEGVFDQKDAFNNNDPFQQDPFNQDDPFKNEDIFDPPKSLVVKYKVLFPFEARNSDELSINPDDIILGIEETCEPGWLMGELKGKKGLFPEPYVEKLPCVKNEDIFDPPKSLVVKYKVLFPFEARNSDELSINPDDIILGIEETCEPGWLMGELKGKKGLFPEAYVEKLPDDVQDACEPGQLQRMSSVGSLRSKKSRQKKYEVASVIANYQALGQEQLNLEKGQLVSVRRKMDSGWWEGEVQVKGKKKQSGWFPASYVKLLSNNPATSDQTII